MKNLTVVCGTITVGSMVLIALNYFNPNSLTTGLLLTVAVVSMVIGGIATVTNKRSKRSGSYRFSSTALE